MVATNLKAETMKLTEKRSGMEAEMNIIIQRLCQPGCPGLSGNLVDSEGFPRTDIDIPTVRADRRRLADGFSKAQNGVMAVLSVEWGSIIDAAKTTIHKQSVVHFFLPTIELRNDHKDITEKISKNIQILHSAMLKPAAAYNNDSGTKDQGANGGMSSSLGSSFAGNSSSAMDVDLALSRPFAMVDEITEASPAAEDGLQLGDQIVKFGSVEISDNILLRLPAEAQNKQGQAVPLVVLRQGSLISMTITPRAWSGRGLLGCHFRML